MNLTPWALFWTIWLVIAGASFAIITCIVTILGFRDLKNMFRMLRNSDTSE